MNLSMIWQLLIGCILFTGLKAQQKISPAQLKEDLALADKALQEAHPGLFRYTNQVAYAQLVRSIENGLTAQLTEKEFLVRLQPLIAQISCGHTKLLPAEYQEGKFLYPATQAFPLRLYFEEQEVYVLGTYGEGTGIPAGARITRINGVPMQEIRKKLSSFLPADGVMQTGITATLNRSFNSFYAGFIGESPVYTIAYEYKGKKHRAAIKGIAAEIIEQAIATQATATQKPFELEWKGSTAWLTIRSFMADKQQYPFEKFADSVFSELKAKQTSNLVIDCRDNEGGIEDWGGYLYSYLADTNFRYYDRILVNKKDSFSFQRYAWLPPFYHQARNLIQEKDGKFYWPLQTYLKELPAQQNRFTGTVYLLVNGRSFSVTSELAAVVKKNKRAIIVGEETGGNGYVNNSGLFAVLTLPNSKLQVGIPLASFYMNSDPVNGRGVVPDYKVPTTITDILNRKDPVAAFVLNKINTSH